MGHQTTAGLKLREMILRGALEPGERVRELDIAARLGLSRTPIRSALPALAQEGLLVRHGARGYAVRRFTAQESLDAVRARAALEGLAARALVGSPRRAATLAALSALLAEGDEVLRSRVFSPELELSYGEMNAAFHARLVEGAASPLLSELIARCNVIPFVDPGSIAFRTLDDAGKVDLLIYAHRQHHAIVDALAASDGARAELLLREHAHVQESNMGPLASGPLETPSAGAETP